MIRILLTLTCLYLAAAVNAQTSNPRPPMKTSDNFQGPAKVVAQLPVKNSGGAAKEKATLQLAPVKSGGGSNKTSNNLRPINNRVVTNKSLKSPSSSSSPAIKQQ